MGRFRREPREIQISGKTCDTTTRLSSFILVYICTTTTTRLSNFILPSLLGERMSYYAKISKSIAALL